jgi:hypothetical protein
MSKVVGFAGIAAVGMCLLLAVPVTKAEPTAASAPASAPASQPTISPAALATAKADIDAGVAWLVKAQNADGGWGKPKSHPAFTAMALKVLMQQPD